MTYNIRKQNLAVLGVIASEQYRGIWRLFWEGNRVEELWHLFLCRWAFIFGIFRGSEASKADKGQPDGIYV